MAASGAVAMGVVVTATVAMEAAVTAGEATAIALLFSTSDSFTRFFFSCTCTSNAIFITVLLLRLTCASNFPAPQSMHRVRCASKKHLALQP